MKFYTNIDKLRLYEFQNKTIYETHHMFFYFCLLPEELKLKVLDCLDESCKKIYEDILNVKDVFCDQIEDSDYLVLPYLSIQLSPRKFFLRHYNDIEYAFEHNKKVLYFYGGDNNLKYNIPHSRGYFFRNSGFFSEKFDNVFPIPTFNTDYFSGHYLEKKLSLSFCGYPKSSNEGVAINSKYCGIRQRVIDKLIDLDYSDFILRNSWCARHENAHRIDPISKKIPSIKFIENLKNNLYGLCVRGGGNYSFRLGETFMMGRIPVLIDTECILPFHDIINYKRNTVYVNKHNSNNFNDINSVILEFHNSHTEEELIQIQKENREIWEKYFNPSSSFKYICNLLNKEKKN